MLAALLGMAAALPVAIAAEPVQEERRAKQKGPWQETDRERPSPLQWLDYSRERFRTLMRMLAERAARTDAKRADEAKAAEDAKRAEEAKQAAEGEAATEAKRVAEEAKAAAEAAATRAEEEARRIAAAKAVEEATRRAAEAKAAEEAKRAEEARRAADAAEQEAKRTAAAKAAEEAKRVADAKAAEEAKRAAEAKGAEETRRVEAARREAAARLPCANAGAKVAAGGWYVVQRGDSLWRIARVHYGYGKTYWRIWSANRRRVTSPRRIYPCQRLYIPRMRGEGPSPLQVVGVAPEPFIRRRAIDTGLPGFAE